ncbi:MAG: 16S rRNA (guanine(527)-N(7))-methyltransferase RsmG [Firmicutes bacterium]|nr:16S rRNA (guanine(527)-N(7))-methyltransferase RsmG [Bacillota bacterium]
MDKFKIYYETLIEWNNKFNLTAITKKDEVYLKHFEDSLAALPIISRYIGGGEVCADNSEVAPKVLTPNVLAPKILDLGSGAGFPGIPLAIEKPDWQFTLIDGTQKKVTFLQHVIKELSLDNVNALHLRAEQAKADYAEYFCIALTRAVAPLDKLIKWAMPLLKKGGHLFAYKGSENEVEIDAAKNALKRFKCELVANEKFSISGQVGESTETLNRSIIVVKKI